MLRHLFTALCCLLALLPAAAQYTTANAHSHNDYLQARPFQLAFDRGFGAVEADVFERNGELYVAHTAAEIDTARTLRRLYLQPLQQMIMEKRGVFAEEGKDAMLKRVAAGWATQGNAAAQNTLAAGNRTLLLLIDFKTAGVPTMQALLQQLQNFPLITSHPQVQLVISGSRPDAALWQNYPPYILFDGLPNASYTAEQLQRIPLFSDNFRSYASWNGRDDLPAQDEANITAVVSKVHALQKKFRFWATPDTNAAWAAMMRLGVDYINTDQVNGLADYLQAASSK
ncbi:hypothetical protein DLD77_04265 [Chitinophaga alhagiae]|uniref:Alkaline phosphatase n=1 Tax=Chitinophaga alhagiae TaxID=2203219 RepID=A0ABM6WAL3_9BACT|nr:phosphatidylinositol-specific phospholipase C/glycerophosphodiester phosphodiesterase family protein [Chitinophaga alhagiae]AWO00970.1 hypothetical protein DLD77_04265 [Chitinophaga alhagiae]